MRFSRAKPPGTFRIYHPTTRRVAGHSDTLAAARKDAAYWSKSTGSTVEIQERFPSGEWVTREAVGRTVKPAKAPAKGRAAHATIPSNAEYERRELAEANQKLASIEREPLADRKEAANNFFEAMRDDPELVAERVDWLIGGNYGYGPMLLAKRQLASKRSNRVANLTQLTGAFEWQSPPSMTRAAWKKLTPTQQGKLEAEVLALVKAYDRGEE